MKIPAIRFVAAVSLFAGAACTTQKPASSTSASDSSASEDLSTLATDNSGLVGAPTLNVDSTKAYMAAIRFGKKSVADSAFEYPFDCPGCKKSPVKLWVVPEKKAYKVDWPTAFVNNEQRGWIVAEIINSDDVRYDPLELDPGEIAYQWVGPINDEGTDHAMAYYKIDKATGRATGPMSPVYTIEYCSNKDWKKRTHSAAKQQHPPGETCATKTYPPGVKPQAGPLFPPNGTWISCVGGCCQVQNTQMSKSTKIKGS